MATARPLAYCPTCEIAFPIATRSEGGAFVVQNSTTHCPNGHFARILNAHYQAFETETQAALEINGPVGRKRILALWDKLRRQELTPEQAQAEAEKISAGLGSIFQAENLSDPTRKAILQALIPAFVAGSEHDEEPIAQQDVAVPATLIPEGKAPHEVPERRKGGNRAFQRSLRHKQRVLMNPR
jgi:hypothetical protein